MILRKIFNKVFFVIFGSDVRYAQVANENWFFMRIAYNACRSFRLNCALPLNVNGYKLRVRPRSPDLQVALTSLGEEYDMLLRYSTDERCLVLDAGGYIGTSALKLSEIFPAATIVSVEPFSQNYSLLVRNTKRNHNIVPLNCALVSADKDEKIGLFDRGTGQWGATILENPADRNAEHVENVSTKTLGNILQDFGFEKFKLIKLDIEGAEKDLFDCDFDWNEKVDMVFVELHDRIVPGCSDSFFKSQRNRTVVKDDGEKYLALRKDA